MRGWYGKRPTEKLIPPETLPDTLQVPNNTIMAIPYHDAFCKPPNFVQAGKSRDWFPQHAYLCLPLVFGNQHGFLITATYDFVVRWDGGPDLDALKIHILEPVIEPSFILLESHFGSGILTIQTRHSFRTPKNINLMVKEPPNYFIDGMSWLNAVVEADNLRRDFTFNIKITAPHRDIYVKKGTPLGCILPYPRYFLDPYRIEELEDPDELARARRTIQYFAKERLEFNKGYPGFRYMEGEDIYGIKFEHHQKSLDGGKWWQSTQAKSFVPDTVHEETVLEDLYRETE